jgi:hypothetical protein
MAETVRLYLAVKILRPSERAEELLAAVAQELGAEPDRQLPQTARFYFEVARREDAVDEMWKALDAAGDDWNDYLLFMP